jgi:hypothetical protein
MKRRRGQATLGGCERKSEIHRAILGIYIRELISGV